MGIGCSKSTANDGENREKIVLFLSAGGDGGDQDAEVKHWTSAKLQLRSLAVNEKWLTKYDKIHTCTLVVDKIAQ